MRLKNNSWAFEAAISKDECKSIIEYGKQQVSKQATTGGGITNKALRHSEVAWLYDPWIMEMIEPYVIKANHFAGWNFQWEPVQQIQFAKYEVGDHYGWHRDTAIPFRKDGKIRKLSITVGLNDDYEGGEMYIDSLKDYWKQNPQKLEKLQKAGSICVFPSDRWHKVDKVTKGTRYSLVIWLMGDPWK